MCHFSLAFQLIISWIRILWEYQIMGWVLQYTPFYLALYLILAAHCLPEEWKCELTWNRAVSEEQSDKYMAEWGASISPHKCVLSSQQRCSTSTKQWHIVSHNSAPLLFIHPPPSTLHPKRLLDFSLSQIAFDSTASTNCSHWKPWDVEIGCGRCLWMFFYFGYLSADKAVASTGYTAFSAQSCALEALLMQNIKKECHDYSSWLCHCSICTWQATTCLVTHVFCKVFRAVQCGWHCLD